MKKVVNTWTVEELKNCFSRILFPEYQREPNLWSLFEKQRLIDSIMRQFDIASLYFYEHEDGTLDCVDGRQRIGAIMSFLGRNPEGEHNGFEVRLINEIYEDDGKRSFTRFAGRKFDQISGISKSDKDETEDAAKFVQAMMSYKISVVTLSDSDKAEEFNLQFIRLNLGTIINAGEKLHAMIGDMRNECFSRDRLGLHDFLESTDIPTRRYARQLVAAQILFQAFEFSDRGGYSRARHLDLQKFFQRNSRISDEKKLLIERIRSLFDLLLQPFSEVNVLKNRAITVSTVLLALKKNMEEEDEAAKLAEFIKEFQHHLRWQVRKGLDSDPEFRYLLDFQRNVSQASAESRSFEARAKTLEEGFDFWQEHGELIGDTEWRSSHPDRDPIGESRA